MPLITVETWIAADPQVCFDLARDVHLHARTTATTKERIVSSTADLLGLGDEVTFEAIHFGVKQRLSSKIIAFDPPREFVDEMQRGAFSRLKHIHRFEEKDGGTLMTDILDFASPLGPLGWVVDEVVLKRYMSKFVAARGRELKVIAEGVGHSV